MAIAAWLNSLIPVQRMYSAIPVYYCCNLPPGLRIVNHIDLQKLSLGVTLNGTLSDIAAHVGTCYGAELEPRRIVAPLSCGVGGGLFNGDDDLNLSSRPLEAKLSCYDLHPHLRSSTTATDCCVTQFVPLAQPSEGSTLNRRYTLELCLKLYTYIYASDAGE